MSIFIILSGFLLQLQHGDGIVDYKTYLKKKIKRFYPLHLLTFLLAIPICIECFKSQNWIWVVISNLTLTQAFIPNSTYYFSFNAVSWYLSLTIFFCLVAPILLKVTKKIQNNGFAVFLVFTIIFEFLLVILFKNYVYCHWLVYVFPVTRIFDFILGMLLCKNISSKDMEHSTLVFCGGLLIFILVSILSFFFSSELFSTALWTFPVLLLIGGLYGSFRNDNHINKFFCLPIFSFLGNMSFELFIIHQIVIKYFSAIANRGFFNIYLAYFLAFIASIGIAFAIKCVLTRKRGISQ